jgi:hypothetical protein
MGMPSDSPWHLDQEMKTLAHERVRCAEEVARCTRNLERITERTVELLVKRLPSAPRSCFLGPNQFLTAGGAPGEGIEPEYVLPLGDFQANPQYPFLGFALGAKGNGFVQIADHEGVLGVSPCLIQPQPTALDLNLLKLYEYITAKVKAEEDTRKIPAPPAA